MQQEVWSAQEIEQFTFEELKRRADSAAAEASHHRVPYNNRNRSPGSALKSEDHEAERMALLNALESERQLLGSVAT